MQRLTRIDEDGDVTYNHDSDGNGLVFDSMILKSLSEYEATNLTPAEIAALLSEVERLQIECASKESYCQELYIRSTEAEDEIERLRAMISSNVENTPVITSSFGDLPISSESMRMLIDKVECLETQISNIHKSLDFADRRRATSKNYVELAINNGLALGQIAVTIQHDYDSPKEG